MMAQRHHVFVRTMRDHFDDRPEAFLTGRGVRVVMVLRIDGPDERCRSCLAIEAEYWLLIGAARIAGSFCRLRGF